MQYYWEGTEEEEEKKKKKRENKKSNKIAPSLDRDKIENYNK